MTSKERQAAARLASDRAEKNLRLAVERQGSMSFIFDKRSDRVANCVDCGEEFQRCAMRLVTTPNGRAHACYPCFGDRRKRA